MYLVITIIIWLTLVIMEMMEEEITASVKSWLKIELFRTSITFYSLDSCCLILLILEKAV